MKKLLVLLLCCTLVAACSDDKRYAPKEGRISVFEAKVPALAQGTVSIGPDKTIENWELPFYNLKNHQPNLSWIKQEKKWQKKIGTPTHPNRLLPTPLATNDAIYTLDGAYTLTKTKRENGEQLWQATGPNNKTGLSLALTKNKVFALSTDGLLTAFDTEDGKQLWQKDFNVATRSPLMADKEAVYLITTHNQFLVLDAKNGQEIWRYSTTPSQTLLLNMAPIAKANNIIVVPFTTGEVMAFEADSGLLLWIQMMVGNRPQDLTEVPQIAAAPIIEDNVVYLSGHANLSGAYNLKTGETKWTVNYGTALTPILSGNTLFMLTTQNELVAIDKKTGKAFWAKQYKPTNKPWQYLALINNELMLADGDQFVYVNPQNGEHIRSEKQSIKACPLVSNQQLITWDHKTNLTLYAKD